MSFDYGGKRETNLDGSKLDPNTAYAMPASKGGGFEYMGQSPEAPPPEEDGKLTWGQHAWDTVLASGTGVTTGVEAAGALLELVAPDAGEYLRQKGISGTQYLASQMDQPYQDALNKSWLSMGEDAAWKDPRAWVSTLAQQIPTMLSTLGAGEGLALGARAAAGLEQAFARKVGYTAAAASQGAGEASSGAGRATDAAGMSEDERLQAMRTAALPGAIAGTVLGGAVEHLTSGAAAKVLGGAVGHAVIGTASEEGIEEAGTQASTELGKKSVGLPVDWQAIAESGVQGAAVGGPIGGVLGQIGNAKERKAAKAAKTGNDAADAAEQAAIQVELDRVKANQPKALPYWEGKAQAATVQPDGVIQAPAPVDKPDLDASKLELEQSDGTIAILHDTIQSLEGGAQRDMFVEHYKEEVKKRGEITKKLDTQFPGWDVEPKQGPPELQGPPEVQGPPGPMQGPPEIQGPPEVQGPPNAPPLSLPAPEAEQQGPPMPGPPAVIPQGAAAGAESHPLAFNALMGGPGNQVVMQLQSKIERLTKTVESNEAGAGALRTQIDGATAKLADYRDTIDTTRDPVLRAQAVSKFKDTSKALKALESKRTAYMEKQHQKAIDELAKLKEQHATLVAKRAKTAMAGPIDPSTGQTLGQQQSSLFPTLDSTRAPRDMTAQNDAVEAEMLRAFDHHGITSETQQGGYPEPVDAPTPVLDHINKSVARSQQAKAAAAVRWAKKAAGAGVPLATPAAKPAAGTGTAEKQAIRHMTAMAPPPPSTALKKASTPVAKAMPPPPTSPSMQPAEMPPPPPERGVTQTLPAPEPISMEEVAATQIGLSAEMMGVRGPDVLQGVPTPPRTPEAPKSLAEQTPLDRVMNLLAKGPQPVDKVLAAMQDAFSATKDGAAFRLMTKLRQAFPASKGAPLALKVVDVDLSNGFQGIYDPKTDTIYVDLKQAENALDTIMHETVHAATLIRMRTNPTFRKQIEAIMEDTAKEWDKQGNPPSNEQAAFNSPEEFIAEALTNWELQDQIDSLFDNGKRSFWKRLKNHLGVAFGMKAEPKAGPLFDRMLDFIPDGKFLAEGDVQQFNADMNRLGISHPVASMLSTFRAQFRRNAFQQANAQGQMPKPLGRIRSGWLKVWTVEQIALSYGPVGKSYMGPKGPIPLAVDAINKYFQYTSAKGDFASAQRETATRVVDMARNASIKEGGLEKLDNIAVDARLWSLDPSLDASHPKNAFGINQPGGVELHTELKKQWGALGDMARKVFMLYRDTAEASRDDTINQIMLARLRSREGMAAADALEAYINHDSRTNKNFNVPEIPVIWQKTLSSAEVQAQIGLLGLDPKRTAELVRDLNEVQHILAKNEGPYIPLRRDGSHMTVVRSAFRTEIVSKSKLDAMVAKNRVKDGGDMEITDNELLPNGQHQITYRYNIVTAHASEREAKAAMEMHKEDFKSRGIAVDHARAALKASTTHDIVGVQAASIEALKAEMKTHFGGALGNEIADQIAKIYMEKLPDTSAKKSQIKARKVAGASRTDILRVYASYMHGMSYMQSQMRFGHKIAHTIGKGADADIATLHSAGQTDQANDLQKAVNYFRERDKATNSLAGDEIAGQHGRIRKLWQRLPALAGAYQLTGMGTIITNAAQPIQVTLPYLTARHGIKRAPAALTKAYTDLTRPWGSALKGEVGRAIKGLPRSVLAIAKGQEALSHKDPSNLFYQQVSAGLPQDEQDMMTALAHRRKIDQGLVADLQSMSRKEGRGWNAVTYLSDAAFIVPQATETMNRMVTALASYRLNKAANPKLKPEELYDIAAADVDQTQLNYTAENRPAYARNEALRPALVFKTYAQGQFYMICRNFSKAFRPDVPAERAVAIKFLSGYFAMTTIATGLSGIMAAEILYWPTVIALSFFADDNDPEELLRQGLRDYLGEWTSMAVKGVPYGIGWADTSRMGIPTILPTQDVMKAVNDPTKSNWFGVIGEVYMGAPGGIVGTAMSGAGDLMNGDLFKAAQKMTPKAFGVNDTLRAWAYLNNGVVNNKGAMTYKPTALENFVRFMGFTPPGVADLQRQTNQLYLKNKAVMDQKSKLVQAFSKAQVAGDIPTRNKVLKDIRAWNLGHPKVAIKREGLRASIRAGYKYEHAIDQYGMNVQTPLQKEIYAEMQGES